MAALVSPADIYAGLVMKFDDVSEIRIHPAIGIARVGNSPSEYYVGPEAPGQVPNAGHSYKDSLGRVKRQAARFRVFAYNKEGSVLGELTAADVKITWTVHVANKKGSWFEFQSRFLDWSKRTLRNRWIQDGPEFYADPNLRTDLIIDPGPKSIVANRSRAEPLSGGVFAGTPVGLGELRSDPLGRLLVLGGLGRSATVNTNKPITRYADNDYWFDDTSDGPVRATITLPNGTIMEAVGAHVIVAPPKFTPAHESLVTLFDVVATASGDRSTRLPADYQVEFNRDIRPILHRIAAYTWVSARSVVGHGPGMHADFGDEAFVASLGDPTGPGATRQAVFSHIRVPAEVDIAKNKEQSSLRYMPPLSGDGGDARDSATPDPDVSPERALPAEQTWMTVTPWQYDLLERWADGKFVTGTPTAHRPLDAFPAAEQPAALDRAALQACVGAPFFPGIEMTYIAADPANWSAPFRLAQTFGAGDVTRWMAEPWQADFFECNLHWWPAARPDDVLPAAAAEGWTDRPTPTDGSIRAVGELAERVPWARGLPSSSPDGDNAMVDYWSGLGFVVPHRCDSGETFFVEEERSAIVALNGRELFYQLMNVDAFPTILPKARAMVQHWLSYARAQSDDPSVAQGNHYFHYTPDAFQNRLDAIYQAMVHDVDKYDPAKDPTFKSRADIVQRIRQLAPFNLTDGAWLRNVGRTGPMDQVHSLLYSVAMDEMGDGDVSRNHCNIYQDLCHSIGLYFPPIKSLDFAYDPEFLDDAFTLPAFELAISQFSDDYFPELLGMTLQLEWGVIESKTTRELFIHYGVDPHFYVMHIGIDNAVNGHGQRAAEAVRLYLAKIEENGGDTAVQAAWRRIWTGYVAFATVGDFSASLIELLRRDLRKQIEALVAQKAVYGRFNHENHTVGGTPINAWFQDPEGFVQALIDNGYLKKGDWEGSRLFQLTSFETGPMYRVFTPEELELWASFARSLAVASDPIPVPGPTPTIDPGQAMAAIVDKLRRQQKGAFGHNRYNLSDAEGVSHPISWWFTQSTATFLAALANPSNAMVIPGNPVGSEFVSKWIAPDSPMGSVFDQPSGDGHRSCREVVTAWITAKCPIPDRTTPYMGFRLNNLPADFLENPTGSLLGMGTVH